MPREPLIRTLFHRRLALLGVAVLLMCVPLSARLSWLTIARGDELRDRAEQRLIRQSWSPTYRGRIIDRKGRVLAHDRAGYDIRLDYQLLDGSWARKTAARLASRATPGWNGLSADAREASIERLNAVLTARVDRIWAGLADALGEDEAVLRARGDDIVRRIEQAHASLVDRRMEAALADRRAKGLATDRDDMDRLLDRARQPIAEQRTSHAIASGVPDEIGFRLERDAARTVPLRSVGLEIDGDLPAMPGLSIRNTTERVYPFDDTVVDVDLSTFPRPLRRDGARSVTARGVGWHLIGRMRETAYREDHERRAAWVESRTGSPSAEDTVDRGLYQRGDAVGAAGLERSMEHTLRGLRGHASQHLLTGEISRDDPKPGSDVRLTIDIALQARIRAIMDPELGLAVVQPWHDNEILTLGTRLYGAAVVLDVRSSEILALVSTPAVPREGDWESQGFASEGAHEAFVQTYSPYINRAIESPYPPGSIVKPLLVAMCPSHGALHPGEGIECSGHLLPSRPDAYRCWVFKQYGLTHSPEGQGLLPDEAIKRSCNIFFYEMGRRLGPSGITSLYQDLGVGDGFDLGVGAPFDGAIGDINGVNDGSDLDPWDPILMGIGQGRVVWTPLHAASAYATLARGGAFLEPTLLADPGSEIAGRRLDMPSWAQREALTGLRRVVNDDDGTARRIRYESGPPDIIFNQPGVGVWGKTGTATAPDLRVDPDGDGPQDARVVYTGDHSWFVLLCGPEGGDPEYAVAVIMEYAGSGGRVSGPIANQIVRALAQEGYLPAGSETLEPSP